MFQRVMKIKILLPGNYSQYHVFIFQIDIVSFSSISKDYIYLQAHRQIFVDRSAWLESSIFCSLVSDVQIHFIYLTSHTALILLTFITFCVLNSIVGYGRSKRVMKVGAFDHRWAFCGEPKFSFNHGHRSISRFKIDSRSQQVKSLVTATIHTNATGSEHHVVEVRGPSGISFESASIPPTDSTADRSVTNSCP
jgi:hypothetical protein